MIKYVLLLIMISAMSGTGFAQDITMNSLRHNGDNWMKFGPAVINSCKSIRLYLSNGRTITNTTSYFISDPVRVEKIKKWLMTNYESLLNSSPVSPKYESVMFLNTIILYSSEEESGEDHLVTIPFNNLTLLHSGYDNNRKSRDVNMLKDLKDLLSDK